MQSNNDESFAYQLGRWARYHPVDAFFATVMVCYLVALLIGWVVDMSVRV